MTKLLTLKKMKKKLILLTLILIALSLSGCSHNHDYKWVMGSSPSLAFEMCDSCFHVRNIEEEYSSPVVSESVVGGPEAFLSSAIDFVAEVDAGMYGYNEEFDIRLTVSMYTSYVKEGPLYVKLAESPYYEIVGDSEFIVSDFGNQDSREQVNEFVFRVKPTNQCSSVEAFDFKIKFTPTDQLKLSPYENYAWYCSPDEEYFYGFNKLSFINDSVGMLINDGEGKTKTFYDSINREYKNGTLDKDSYIDRIYEYNLNDSVNLEVSYVNNKTSQPYFKYSSKNIRAEFYLKDDLEYLISLFDDRTEEPSDILSKKLINILYENGYITEEEYKNEIKYIENNPTSRRSYIIYHQFIPFSLYVKMNKVDYVYKDDDYESNVDNSLERIEPHENSANEEDWGAIYLSHDKINIGESVNVTISTDFCCTIASYSVEIQEGLLLSSNVTINEERIIFSLTYTEKCISPKFTLNITLSDEQETTFSVNIYGYSQEQSLYLSQWSEEEAYNVYWDYENAEQKQTVRSLEEIQQQLSTEYNVNARSVEATDSSISGELYWKDTSNNTFPMQYSLISFYDREPLTETYLGSCLTNHEGKYTFNFINDTSEDENGFDITMVVWAAGTDVSVRYGRTNLIDLDLYYYKEYYLENDLPVGHYLKETETYEMENEGGIILFGHAIQISQAAIIASKYYESMKGLDVVDVPITYPHNIEGSGCFYSIDNNQDGRIYIVGAFEPHTGTIFSYESWDVIMHEYGHFVADKEEIKQSPGGGHYISDDMAEHYMQHFTSNPVPNEPDMNCILQRDPDKFTAEECKRQGEYLAWSEGFASYFSLAAQQYAIENLFLSTNINTVGNTEYNSYNGVNYDIEDIDINVNMDVEISDSNEITIHAILYDMYDSSTEIHDSIELGHQTMWNLIVNSKAKTFDEFDDYFLIHCTNATDLEKYNKLLSSHHLAPSNVRVTNGVTTYCPTFTWSWTEQNSTVFFDDRTYRLNFYDSNRSLIATTEEFTCTDNSYTISESLWQTILDTGSSFYVSVTIYENNDPITDYEGEWKLFNSPIIEANVGTLSSKYLDIDGCYWYKFTAPQTGDYKFETSGAVDTFGEIFNRIVIGKSTSGIVSSYDSGGENNNFSITKYMVSGETFYLRVRGKNWSSTGSFSLSISYSPHVHSYTNRYRADGNELHKAYCVCGAYIFNTHTFRVTVSKTYCTKCGYISVSDVPGFIVSIDPEIKPLSKKDDEEK